MFEELPVNKATILWTLAGDSLELSMRLLFLEVTDYSRDVNKRERR